jgi:hypothetical protein
MADSEIIFSFTVPDDFNDPLPKEIEELLW